MEIHTVVLRPDGSDLGDDHAQVISLERVDERLAELRRRRDRRDVFDPGTAQDAPAKAVLDELHKWAGALAPLRRPA